MSLEKERLSLSVGALTMELGGRSPLLGKPKGYTGRLWEQAFLSTGEAGGEIQLPGTSRDSKRGLWKGSVCL